MIAQWTAREHEIAIRASIGASRGRIVRALLTESVLIAALRWPPRHRRDAGLARLIVLTGRREVAVPRPLDRPARASCRRRSSRCSPGSLAGVAPALYETRRLHTNPLRAMAGSDRVRQRWRSALVVLEITVTVALLVQTASMVDGYLRTRRARWVIDTRPLLDRRGGEPGGRADRATFSMC